MSDELPTAARVSDPGIRALYRLENRWQAWLDVEAALAKAQEELGIIPTGAAEAIGRAAHLELLDRARIDEGFARTGHTIVPLVWELSRVTGEPYGGWVHWGATTQNITQTGDLLVLRQAHRIFLGLIGEALSAMADLAERGADMPIAGRTHGQHALPATFGYKPAVWIDEMIRHVERLRQAAPRLFVAMLGGGAGTFASLGAQGPAVQAAMGKHLGMAPMRVPSRTIGDHLAENICLFGLLAATCSKIAREIYTLMKTEFGEVEEPVPPGTVGSSTMPQKRNPKLCQDIIAAAAEVRASVPLALEAMQTEHEADRTTSLIMDAAEARASIALGRRIEPPRRGDAGPAPRPRAHAAQPRSRRRPHHGRSRHARSRRPNRPPARPRRRLRRRAVGVCRRPVLRRAVGGRPARDRASGCKADRRLARPDRLYRPVRRNGARRRRPRPRHRSRDRPTRCTLGMDAPRCAAPFFLDPCRLPQI